MLRILKVDNKIKICNFRAAEKENVPIAVGGASKVSIVGVVAGFVPPNPVFGNKTAT